MLKLKRAAAGTCLGFLACFLSMSPVYAGGLAGMVDEIGGKIKASDSPANGQTQNQSGSPSQRPPQPATAPAPAGKNLAAALVSASNGQGSIVNIKSDGSIVNQPAPTPKPVQGILERAKRTEELNKKISDLQQQKIQAQAAGASPAALQEIDKNIGAAQQEFKQDLGRDPLSQQGLSNQPTGGAPAPEPVKIDAPVQARQGGAVDEDENGNFDPDKYDQYVEAGGKVDSQGRPVAKPITDGPVEGAGKSESAQPPQAIPTSPWRGSGNSNGLAVTDAPVAGGSVKPPAPAVDEDENGNFDPDKYDQYVENGGKTDANGKPVTAKPITDGPVEGAGVPNEPITDGPVDPALANPQAPETPDHYVPEEDPRFQTDGRFDPDKYDDYIENGGPTDSQGRPLPPTKPITDGPVEGAGVPVQPITDGPVLGTPDNPLPKEPSQQNQPAEPAKLNAENHKQKIAEHLQVMNAVNEGLKNQLNEMGDTLMARPVAPVPFFVSEPMPLLYGATPEDVRLYNEQKAEAERNRRINLENDAKYKQELAAWEQRYAAMQARHQEAGEQRKKTMTDSFNSLQGPQIPVPAVPTLRPHDDVDDDGELSGEDDTEENGEKAPLPENELPRRLKDKPESVPGLEEEENTPQPEDVVPPLDQDLPKAQPVVPASKPKVDAEQDLQRKRQLAADHMKVIEAENNRRMKETGRKSWNEEEHKRYREAEGQYSDLAQMTPEEEATSAQTQAVRDRMMARIRQRAEFEYGLNDKEAEAERKAAYETGKAAHKTWGDWFATGKAANLTEKSIHQAREEKLRAEAMIDSANDILQNPNLSAEERRAVENILAVEQAQKNGASEAITDNALVVAAGAAFDGASLGVGRLGNKLADKLGKAVSSGAKAATPAAQEAGANAAGNLAQKGEEIAARAERESLDRGLQEWNRQLAAGGSDKAAEAARKAAMQKMLQDSEQRVAERAMQNINGGVPAGQVAPEVAAAAARTPPSSIYTEGMTAFERKGAEAAWRSEQAAIDRGLKQWNRQVAEGAGPAAEATAKAAAREAAQQ